LHADVKKLFSVGGVISYTIDLPLTQKCQVYGECVYFFNFGMQTLIAPGHISVYCQVTVLKVVLILP